MPEENFFGKRIGNLEVQTGRHDERIKTMEESQQKIQKSVDSIQKSFYRLAAVFVAISIIAQFVFKIWEF